MMYVFVSSYLFPITNSDVLFSRIHLDTADPDLQLAEVQDLPNSNIYYNVISSKRASIYNGR